jgi:ACS family hexuronate transporter-like MFS transporter
MTNAGGGHATAVPTGAPKTSATRIGHYRWVICALLFAATSLLYVDRLTIGYLKGALSLEYGWTQADYASIVQFFMFAYAIGFVLFGQLIDKFGAKRGYMIAVGVWTMAHLGCALIGFLPVSWVLVSFMISQAVLGLGQGGNFPAALKTVAEWFPQRERSLAIGWFNAGTNVGAILTPLIVPFVLLAFGWQWCFVATGLLSILWLLIWIPFYSSPAKSKFLKKEELAHIESDKYVPVPQLPWLTVLLTKETWAYGLGKLLTDPVWFFYSFWLPSFFIETYKDQVGNIAGVALPVIVIFLISDVGSVVGGWMSSAMIKAGLSVNKARKFSMLICAACVLPVGFMTMWTHDLWLTTFIIGIAAAAHQAFSANLMTLTSDLMPKEAVGRCSGIGGTAGAIGGIIMAKGVAKALSGLGGYSAVFLVAGVIYFVAVLVIHLISPRLTQADFEKSNPLRFVSIPLMVVGVLIGYCLLSFVGKLEAFGAGCYFIGSMTVGPTCYAPWAYYLAWFIAVALFVAGAYARFKSYKKA